MKRLFLVLAVLFWPVVGFSQNTLFLPSLEGTPGDTLLVNVVVNNSEPFEAVQLTLPLDEPLEYVAGSAELSGRAVDHVLRAKLSDDHVLNLVAYSPGGSAFSGTAGSVLHFRLTLGTTPGTYVLDPAVAILGNASMNNILTSVQPGQITIYAPNGELDVDTLRFGRTVVGEYADLSFGLLNTGNRNLAVDSIHVVPSEHYRVLTGWNPQIPPGGTGSFVLRFQPKQRGNQKATVEIYASDPDHPVFSLAAEGTGYRINELHVADLSVRSGTDTLIVVKMNNQEPITSVQFDLNVPEVARVYPERVRLAGRAQNHQVSANYVGDHRVRVVVYSTDGQAVSGNNGELVFLPVRVEGPGGVYSVTLDQVILTNQSGENLVSGVFGGYISIRAGDLDCVQSLDFGRVSVLDTVFLPMTIRNSGDDTLKISALQVSGQGFSCTDFPPIFLPPGTGRQLHLRFHAGVAGKYSGKLIIRSNDPDENPFAIALAAVAYSPNRVFVADTTGIVGQRLWLRVCVSNLDPFTAFQFDLILPEKFVWISDSVHLSTRAADHRLAMSEVEPGRYRILAYSPTQSAFSGHAGAVLHFLCEAPKQPGRYQIGIQSVILGGLNGKNIVSGYAAGQVELRNVRIVFLADPPEGGRLEPGTGLHEFPPDTVLTLKAVANPHYRFSGWSGPVQEPDSSQTRFQVTSDDTIMAHFVFVNTLPSVANVHLVPEQPAAGQSLHLSYTFQDADGDQDATTRIIWYRNGMEVVALQGARDVPADSLRMGDVWQVAVVPNDGYAEGSPSYSNPVAVLPVSVQAVFWTFLAGNDTTVTFGNDSVSVRVAVHIQNDVSARFAKSVSGGIAVRPLLSLFRIQGSDRFYFQNTVRTYYLASLTAANYRCDFTFRYSEAALHQAGISQENDLVVGASEDLGATWRYFAPECDSSANELTVRNVDRLSLWAIGRRPFSQVLPVELESFTASVQADRSVLLIWKTASEIDNLGFAVERKGPGTGAFARLAFIPTKGNSGSPTEYRFLDHPESPGSYAYRLRQINRDGSFVLSGEKWVNLSLPAAFELVQNYPNPFRTGTVISFTVPVHLQGKTGTLKVYDFQGRLVYRRKFSSLSAGKQQLRWNGRDRHGGFLASGTYFCVLEIAGKRYLRKMILLH